MEEEARTILREAVTMPIKPIDGLGLGSRFAAHFADLGGIELELPQRISPAQPAISSTNKARNDPVYRSTRLTQPINLIDTGQQTLNTPGSKTQPKPARSEPGWIC